jgi:hypothetical protein
MRYSEQDSELTYRALHTNYARFLLDTGNRGIRILMQCNERKNIWQN